MRLRSRSLTAHFSREMSGRSRSLQHGRWSRSAPLLSSFVASERTGLQCASGVSVCCALHDPSTHPLRPPTPPAPHIPLTASDPHIESIRSAHFVCPYTSFTYSCRSPPKHPSAPHFILLLHPLHPPHPRTPSIPSPSSSQLHRPCAHGRSSTTKRGMVRVSPTSSVTFCRESHPHVQSGLIEPPSRTFSMKTTEFADRLRVGRNGRKPLLYGESERVYLQVSPRRQSYSSSWKAHSL